MKSTCLCVVITLLGATDSRAADFSRSIRPILSDHCFQCHGPDEKERAADLRLDTEAGVEYAFGGGSIADSEAWRRINSTDQDEQMPPPEFRKPLTAAQRSLIEQWMQDGALWTQHWSFAKPERQLPPEVDGVTHPIDQFIVTTLRAEGLQPAPTAARETLIRRLALDLIGLPPTIEEIDRFVGDQSPDAYEQLVDRLLDSQHFGERMAIEWLDGARYADTNGYQNDFKRSMWPWRDWVIRAFNDNMRFDRFVVEQLAGDLLPSPSLEQRIATGFNRNHRTVTEFGSIEAEWLVENVIDRVETTATVFLGLTMGCARCHDHKYDPISQREFYQFFSFFNNVKELGVNPETRGNTAPKLPVMSAAELKRLDELKRRVQETESTVNSLREELPQRADAWNPPKRSAAVSAPVSQFHLELAGDANARLSDDTIIPPAESSGTIVWKDESIGAIAKFVGLHSLSYGQAINPDRDNPFTLTFWIKPEKNGAVLDKMDPENVSRGFDVYWKTPGTLEVHLIHSWPTDAIKVSTEKVGVIPKDRWSHVAISYDGSSTAAGIELFVNGQPARLKAEVDQLQSSFSAEQPVRIGRRSRGRTFFGSLADLRYYTDLVDASAISDIANERLAVVFSAAVASDPEAVQEERSFLFGEFSNGDIAQQFRRERDQLASLQAKLTKLEAKYPTVMVMEELPEPRKTFVLTRGEYDKADKSQPVTADIPQFLGALPTSVKKDRLALANWVVSVDNPLTARVRVNRIWQMLFGVGLVKTTENFGVQAEAPSHPELLDWLATEFVQSGWDTKRLLKLIVTSATYRQSSATNAELVARDPANRLLARGPRFRLSAELIRDNALAVSGLLTTRIGGESIKPYQPDKLWDELAGGAGEGKYVQSHGDDLYRRSLYIYRKRTVPHPVTNTFDAPSFEICQVARARTNTPLQALALLNDVTYVEAACKLGERMLADGGQTDESRLAYGFRLATGRRPNRVELNTLHDSYESKRELFGNNPDAAPSYLSHGESESTVEAPVEQMAAYAAVASILLNLDETITKE